MTDTYKVQSGQAHPKGGDLRLLSPQGRRVHPEGLTYINQVRKENRFALNGSLMFVKSIPGRVHLKGWAKNF